ncbi:MAG: hypothetical protein M5R36_29340 [Deltaproteobacteria bacterium]|nr:hypothetical protein [Deltaproteobacteria bacterium]
MTLLVAASAAVAGTYDFEDGQDGATVQSPIAGIEFTPAFGYQWIYGDWRVHIANGDPKYGGAYPDGVFFSDGNFFAFLGPDREYGKITFTSGPGSYFSLDYSAAGPIELNAFDEYANLVDTDVGAPNVESGVMDLLFVEGQISWVEIGFPGGGNHWLIDNISTDEIEGCRDDAECDDGAYCNGAETCVSRLCRAGTPVDCGDGVFCNGTEVCDETLDRCMAGDDPCGDDGLFCSGDEFCSEEDGACMSTGDPCEEDQICDEPTDQCVASDDTDEIGDDLDEESGTGEITGGCCGC